MKSAEIREGFLKYFEGVGHTRVKSSSLIPAADPTLLFTNAGMNQFKDCFLGIHDPGYRRATTCQKCVRAGGKHNDLENVGFTARHHTFFEMLGNFSFGDYFKKDAVAFAWELLTQKFQIPKDRLYITIFEKDDEAGEFWKKVGVPADRISKLGEKDNFWAMGDTGPCGPCTEIHFDWGEKFGCKRSDCAPGCDCGRFLEIWNLVFMQFNRDESGTLAKLPKPSVDTGAGLERVAAVLQGQRSGMSSNYDTDLFIPILTDIGAKVSKKYGENEDANVSMRVIADHLRSGTFLMSDGVVPSNEGRGYVLRRILRRAIRHGKKLGQEKPFLFQLVQSVVRNFSTAYPELKTHQGLVETMMKEEEVRFHETLHRGMGLLEETIQSTLKAKQKLLPGDIAFKLYDTFGFPLDLIETICREQKLGVDEKGFSALMEKQRSGSQWKSSDSVQKALAKHLEANALETRFLGYETLKSSGKLLFVFDKEGAPANKLSGEGYAVFDETPFYAESGGQVGDKGMVSGGGSSAEILSTFKVGKTFVHSLNVKSGALEAGKSFDLLVDGTARKSTAINHTATHLMHAALRTILGDRVKQAGSLVEPSRLRFDFTFPRALTPEEIKKIEEKVNQEVFEALPVEVNEMDYAAAMQSGALAFFDEKYGNRVRVVRVGKEKPVSVELCGGTHLKNIGDIGLFKVISESAVASGTRRIEAITSAGALQYLSERNEWFGQLENKYSAKGDALIRKLDQAMDSLKAAQKENERLQLLVAQAGVGKGAGAGGALWDKSVDVNGYKIVREIVPGGNPKVLRSLVDQIRDKLKNKVVVLLASESDGKAFLCLGLSKDLVGKWDAVQLIKPLAEAVGGTGGGRSDFAQAGGSNPSALSKAFTQLEEWVREQ